MATAKTVQTALERLGYPASLSSAPDEAFSIPKRTFRLRVLFEGHPVVLEVDIAQATDAGDPESLRGYIATRAAPNFAISNGDDFLTLTFRSDADQVRAGLYLGAAMILAFDAYGSRRLDARRQHEIGCSEAAFATLSARSTASIAV